MISVVNLPASVDAAVGDERFPTLRYEDMVYCFPGPAIGTVPDPVMDLSTWEPGIGYAEVSRSAQVKKTCSIVIGEGVRKYGSSYWLYGVIMGIAIKGSIDIGQDYDDIMGWDILDELL